MSSILDRFRLDGKVALITGAGRGIGAATAIAYADAGADVVISARTESQLEETAQAVRERGRRALVADDNATNRMILAAMLAGYGIDAVIVADGQEAVDGWGPGAFDVVLLDISMPGMDGLTALEHLRARMAEAGEPHVPILAITANAMTHQVQEYLAAGFDGHIGKPVRLDRLGVEIARAIGQPVAG